MTPPDHARPSLKPGQARLLLVIMLPLTLLAQGVVLILLYPRGAFLAALPAAVLGIGLAGALLYVLPARGAARLPMAGLAVVIAVLVSFASAAVRAMCMLTSSGHEFDVSRLTSLRGWYQLQRELMALPLCCGKGGRDFNALDHWLYLGFEQAAFLGGAVWVVVYLVRRGEPS